MIDPYTHCPRCDIRYSRGTKASSVYKHLCCLTCGFKKFIDPLMTKQKYQIVIMSSDNATYRVTWKVYFDDDEFTLVSKDVMYPIVIDYWIPFDITLDTLNLYLTFS